MVDFGRNTVVDIGTKLNKRFIPDMGRFMFVNSDYYNALQKDEALYKAYITPQAGNVVVSGMLPDVNGLPAYGDSRSLSSMGTPDSGPSGSG